MKQEIADLKYQVSQNPTQRIGTELSLENLEQEEEKSDPFLVEGKGKKNSKDECPCICGRLEDDKQMKIIQTELFKNFQQRIQLRRALMEVEEQNALNVIEIKKK